MTDKYNYKSLSLRNHTIKELDKISTSMFPGYNLSRAKTVEILIKDRLNSVETNNGKPTNEKTQSQEI